MTQNLENLSSAELKELIKNAEKALKSVDARRKAEAKRAAEEAAKEFGFSLDDIYKDGGKGPKGVAKYANPADPSQTWTGRGRKPNWIVDALKAGKSIDDMMI